MRTIRVIDFETTGIPTPEDAHEVVEIGWCDVYEVKGGCWRTPIPGTTSGGCTPYGSSLYCPSRPIPPEASAIHHITEMDTFFAPEWDPDECAAYVDPARHGHADFLAAHNAKFDRLFWSGPERPWICTYKCAVRIWPDAPGHGNQVLRYWLGLKVDPDLAMLPHRAGPDAYITALLLERMLEKYEVDELVKLSSEPALLPKIRFGKHQGARWEDVPKDYLQWICSKGAEFDEDIIHTARHHLGL